MTSSATATSCDLNSGELSRIRSSAGLSRGHIARTATAMVFLLHRQGNNLIDKIGVAHTRGHGLAGGAGLGRDVRIGIDLEDIEPAAPVHADVHPGVSFTAGQAERGPGRF